MCGRFVSASPPDELARYFGAEVLEHPVEPSYNVAPTNQVHVVRRAESAGGLAVRQLASLRWGLVPFWAKDVKVGSKMINARAETVCQKPAFKQAFSRRRCLVPVDGFYEWSKLKGEKGRQPHYIHRVDGEPVVLAGLWERWRQSNQDGTESQDVIPVETFTILTCSPNAMMSPIHDRMPVLVAPKHWDAWLADGTDEELLVSLLRPAPDNLLTAHPVSLAVNNVANDGKNLIEADSGPGSD